MIYYSKIKRSENMAKKKVKVNSQDSKLVAILSYLIIGMIWYAFDDKVKDGFSKYHVKQALNAWIIVFGLMCLWSILALTIILIPFIGVLSFITNVIMTVLIIIGILSAANGSKSELPIIGQYAKRYLKF